VNSYLRNISLFNKDRIKINHKILIVGRGRWSQVIINELSSNFSNLEKIFVFSSKFKDKKKNINKKIIYTNSFNLIKKQKIKYIVIANKNSEHLKYIKLFLKNGNYILCEKPLMVTKNQLANLTNRLKKNKCSVAIGMQFFYAFYFNFINKKVIANKKIKKIKIDWLDKKNEKRNGFSKKHDLKINFIEDIFYHVYSILYLLMGVKKYSFDKKPLKKNKSVQLEFVVNNKINAILNSSRNHNQRSRTVKIYFNNKDYLFLNFSKHTDVKVKFNGKKIKIPSKLMSKTIKYQLYFFLRLKKNDKKIELNNFINLENFFDNLYLLKKKL